MPQASSQALARGVGGTSGHFMEDAGAALDALGVAPGPISSRLASFFGTDATSAYNLFTQWGVPNVWLNFLAETLPAGLTSTRASVGTRTNRLGALETLGNNAARLDYHPLTLQPRGLLIEGPRTNLYLNSGIIGTPLVGQDVVVTAVPTTLSFYGSGTVTLSGAATATVVGAGPYPARTVLTFTPSAGTLTTAVSGDVKFAQLEVGSFESSFIPTGATPVARAVDNVQLTPLTAAFSQSVGTLSGIFEYVSGMATTDSIALMLRNGVGTSLCGFRRSSISTVNLQARFPTSFDVVMTGTLTSGTLDMTGSYGTSTIAAYNGGKAVTVPGSTPPGDFDRLCIGSSNGSSPIFGWVKQAAYYKFATDATTVQVTVS